MPNKTTNYQLNQWQGSDAFLRSDFNEDNAKVEAALTALAAKDKSLTQLMETKADQSALATKTEIVTGTYTGDGAASQEILLGFQPKAVLVCSEQGRMGDSTGQVWVYGGLALVGHPVEYSGMPAVEITGSGFRVYFDDENVLTNQRTTVYHYIAFK